MSIAATRRSSAFSLGTVTLAVLLATGLSACGDTSKLPPSADVGATPTLPPPNKALFPTVHIAPATGWPQGVMPQPMAGLRVTALAAGLDHPRWVYVLPNGDVLVAESNKPPKPEAGFSFRGWVMGVVVKRAGAGVPSANRITLLRDVDGDGQAETRTVFLQGLNSPFGMALVGKELFIANADALVKVPYEDGQTAISATPVKVVDLPAGINHHWTKNVMASRDGSKLYVTVGSNSNVGENGMEAEVDRAAILEVDPRAGTRRVFASGLRNPNGLGWSADGTLWTVVNERDEIGSDLVPDYLTSVKDGAFYGWPYSYYGQNVDVRIQPPRPDLVAKAVVPDYALGAHVAPLGMVFSEGKALPASLASGVFVGEHGSWNRKPFSGYKVVFVPFAGNKPSGQPVDVLTGFLSPDGKAYGRPVGVAIDKRGGLLVADDVGNVIWRVAGTSAR
ncbi:sorbosone dehydrogenase family protein [Polaromonas sp. SM01]|uniref:PQQ-dependent sugar dehydrogenase n=1 Tax=Polaromonas sp. SM01 TaxID=3085630 RepID=UPI002981B5A7|nr:sorbosone dehydrogenase family protein [Polaromonas sp. SM01]MDW5444653.1 sorbosone dehydrogenase family protein [Polaromonas sp. SM01]